MDSTIVMSAGTSNNQKCSSLRLKEQDEVSVKQRHKDCNEELKQFYPRLASCMITDLMKTEVKF